MFSLRERTLEKSDGVGKPTPDSTCVVERKIAIEVLGNVIERPVDPLFIYASVAHRPESLL